MQIKVLCPTEMGGIIRVTRRIHGAGIYIYTNIGGILMVNVTIYSSTMDPMGYVSRHDSISKGSDLFQRQKADQRRNASSSLRQISATRET